MKEAIFFCIVGLPPFGKEGSGTPVFKILMRALMHAPKLNSIKCLVSASALYSVGLNTALCTGERERRCLVTPCESVSKALDCLSANNFCIQLVPFDYSPHKEWLFQLLSFTVFYYKAPIVIYTMSIHYVF